MTKRTTKKTVAECSYVETTEQVLMNLRMMLAVANRKGGDEGQSEAFWAGKVYEKIEDAFTLVLDELFKDESPAFREGLRNALFDHDPDAVSLESLVELTRSKVSLFS